MPNYGFKISDPTYDVTKAADYQLLFNSAWPSVAIAYQSTQTVTIFNAGPTVTFNHNLGFPPFCMVFGTTIGKLTSGGNTNVYVPQSTNNNDWFLASTTKNSVSFTASAGGPAGQSDWQSPYNKAYTLICYNIDLSNQQDYTFVQPANYRAPYDNNFGFKLAKEGKSTNSKDLRDFIIHTRGQAPAVLSVLTEKSATINPVSGLPNISYTNPANYQPWIFGYGKKTANGIDTYNPALLGTQTPPALFYDSVSKFRVEYDPRNGYTGGTLLVLRDPLFSANSINVVY